VARGTAALGLDDRMLSVHRRRSRAVSDGHGVLLCEWDDRTRHVNMHHRTTAEAGWVFDRDLIPATSPRLIRARATCGPVSPA
jgi:hypothetical protein